MNTPSSQRTFGYYLLFICLGLGIAITGPTLPALAAQTSTLVGDMGWLFLAGAFGYTLGTTLGGWLFDRMRGHPVLGFAQLTSGLMLFLLPLAPWFWLLLVVAMVKGVADGVVNTGGNTLLIWTYGEKVGPYMNGMHFFFGLGAFLSPLLLAQIITVTDGYRWAYWILASVAILVGVRLLALKDSPRSTHSDTGPTEVGVERPIYYPFVISAVLFLFFYVGAEISFAGWVYTYALTLNLADAVGAAYLTSGFWLSFTIGRLISIPMATRFTPPQIIWTALLICVGILSLLILNPGSSWVLWVAALGLGLCLAPIWPTGFTLAGQSLKLTARVSGLILLGDSFGAMVLPWLVGQVIALTSPAAMVYLVLASLLLNLLAFFGMLRLKPSSVVAE